jgi:hypothetical protein
LEYISRFKLFTALKLLNDLVSELRQITGFLFSTFMGIWEIIES